MSSATQEFPLTNEDFTYIARLIREQAGIIIGDQKRALVYSRISRRLRDLRLSTFADYRRLLQDPARAHDELEHFINALTTNLTSFFREPHHFEFLEQTLLPALVKSKSDKIIRAWSAGCSSGEEPYTLAMTLADALPSGWEIRIQASELDTNILREGMNGIYPVERLEKVPQSKVRKWFRRGKGANEGKARVVPELREMIQFQQLNLLHDWSFKTPFDFIFCRNVVIYFDKETQVKLFDKYARALVPDGHLFIGHSESLFQKTDRFKLIGKTIYQKIK